jgi:hypothetical protein
MLQRNNLKKEELMELTPCRPIDNCMTANPRG